MERISTGIDGLDEIIEGGFLKGSSVLVSGETGAGKTIFSLQYIYKGALAGGKGAYITFESGYKNLWWNINRFGWNFRDLQQKELIKVFKIEVEDYNNFGEEIKERFDNIIDLVKKHNIQRLAIDSITNFIIWKKEEAEIRYLIYKLLNSLKEVNCTTIFTSEIKGGSKEYSRFGIEEFVADGVIMLYFIPPHRGLFVRKMRGTNHSLKIHPLMITNNGIAINNKEEIMREALYRTI